MTKQITIGQRIFPIGKKPYVVGILNVTPDSFSDGGRYTDTDKALFQVSRMIEDGADIIDIGGESTRPGYTPVSVQEEIERTCFVIEAVKEKFNIPVSLDTSKYEVANTGLLAGADMINDVWGLRKDPRMARLIADKKVPCCLMHNRENTAYTNFFEDVLSELCESISSAQKAGIDDERIIIDPGIGFAKNTEQNIEILSRLERFTALGYPVLLGTSRKSFIGDVLSVPVSEREEGTLATSVMGYLKGCSFFRVHDVKANVRALKMTEAVTRG